MLPDTLKYFTSKKGKLANSIVEAGAFLKSRDDIEHPDIQRQVSLVPSCTYQLFLAPALHQRFALLIKALQLADPKTRKPY